MDRVYGPKKKENGSQSQKEIVQKEKEKNKIEK